LETTKIPYILLAVCVASFSVGFFKQFSLFGRNGEIGRGQNFFFAGQKAKNASNCLLITQAIISEAYHPPKRVVFKLSLS